MKKDFMILGIESTCDETSAALLKGGKEIVTNVIYSQIDEHKKYHGVVPELASRAHAAKIATVIHEALGDNPIDCVAFASGPGLPGGLMVGRVAAETLANFKKVPILGINHLEGHIFACDFEGTEVKNRLDFPLVALVVSGGHTELWYVKGYGEYKVLGKTRDDAAGTVSFCFKGGTPGLNPTGIGALRPETGEAPAGAAVYDLSGRRISAAARGVSVKVEKYADGTSKAVKVVK